MSANDAENDGLSRREDREVTERVTPRAAVVYEVVRQEGVEELERSTSTLLFSGVAAGLSIGFSVVAEGLLMTYLPDAGWRPLIENFGYCVGFLFVVLGRQQLFTENTLTAVLPLAAEPSFAMLRSMLRLWGLVFVANVAGCLVFALFLVKSSAFPAAVDASFDAISKHLMHNEASQMFVKGIVAGWLIATMVWLMPLAEGSAKIWVIVLATYLIALGDLTHIIAGSTEAFYLWIQGDVGAHDVIFRFMGPTFAGNVVGGTALFALIAYGQVHDEI